MKRELLDWMLVRAHQEKEKVIGLTMTVLALLTAGATLAGHRAHTEEVVSQTLATDKWGFYQAKHIRAHLYEIEAEKAVLDHKDELARRFLKTSIYEECGQPAYSGCTSKSTVFKESPLKDLVQSFSQPEPALISKPISAIKRACTDQQPAPGRDVVNAAEKNPKEAAHKDGATDIYSAAQNCNAVVDLNKKQALRYDVAEILLECSIMFCGIALLVGTETQGKLAYFITSVGVCIAVAGVVVALNGWFLG